jgi:hypothetical protein
LENKRRPNENTVGRLQDMMEVDLEHSEKQRK